jgi:hypothetical protein
MNKWAVLITVVLMGLVGSGTVLGLDGSGTEGDPWLIQSLDDFNDFAADANYWDDYTRLETDVNLAGMVYERAVIAPDVNYSGVFQGIAFTGVFDGNDHEISNLTCDSNGNYIGFLGYIDGPNAQIKKLGIVDCNLTVNGLHIGSLVGQLQNGAITDCHIDGGSTSGLLGVGGLAGSVYLEGTVTDCSVKRIVVEGLASIGGLAGSCHGSINNGHATATVVGGSSIGGLAGANFGTITSSSANVSIIS